MYPKKGLRGAIAAQRANCHIRNKYGHFFYGHTDGRTSVFRRGRFPLPQKMRSRIFFSVDWETSAKNSLASVREWIK